ncbi:MAG TPA: serine hydrolase domain-containing protein, partial [Chloroflexaceae bacterium]|nr:serine hydrolase domain-containing protein [Chloroflexaceae bacterium]
MASLDMADGGWLEAARPRIGEALDAEGVPGLVVAAARAGDAPAHLVLGADAAGAPLAADSLFPVASLTKLATALAALRLVAVGAIELDAPLARYLPDAAAARPGVTPRRLLSHTAGLPLDLAPGAAPYEHGLTWAALARACLATPLAAAPGERVCYSNVGYGLLAIAVERLTGRPFPAALRELVLGPLGVEGFLGEAPPRPAAHLGGRLGEHAGSDREPFNSAFWRGLALPWAGLVTTASGALALVRAFGGAPAGFLPQALLAEATADQTGGAPGGTPGFLQWPRCPWGLGPQLRGAKRPFYLPAAASPATCSATRLESRP